MTKRDPSAKKNAKPGRGFSFYLVLFMLVILLASIIFTTTYVRKLVEQAEEPFEVRLLPYEYKVANHVAFNLDDDLLHLGTGVPGTTLQRDINLSSPEQARVEILWDGPGNLSVNKNDFILEPNTLQEVRFYLSIGENESEGNYTGIIYFNFYKE